MIGRLTEAESEEPVSHMRRIREIPA